MANYKEIEGKEHCKGEVQEEECKESDRAQNK